MDNSSERAKRIREQGIKIEGMSSVSVDIKSTANPKDVGYCDLVVICVKSYSTEDACKEIKEIVGEKTYVLTLQNGIGNVKILNDYFGPDKVIAGITNHGATLLGIGHTRHAGKGDTIMGLVPDGVPVGEIMATYNSVREA